MVAMYLVSGELLLVALLPPRAGSIFIGSTKYSYTTDTNCRLCLCYRLKRIEVTELLFINKQLKVFEEAGLVIRSLEGQKRPCRLAHQRLIEIAQWMNDYRALWELKFDRIETYLNTLTETKK
jgi:hypothetical protein